MRLSSARLAACLFVVLLGSACSSSPSGGASGIGGDGAGGSANGGSAATAGDATDGPPDLVDDNGGSSGSSSSNCQPQSCEALGKNCGVVADGCGQTLDCGVCADGQSCGIVEGNVCTALAELCVPQASAVSCADKQCGTEGDGCGGTVDCGECGAGQQCGLEHPFQCATVPVFTAEECPARIESCDAVGADCGTIGNGCGGTIECGGCGPGQLCGLNAPQVCGSAPACQPNAPELACAGKCGLASNGCGSEVGGGVIDCGALFPCANGQTCGGGGVNNVCGSGGVTCQPIGQGTACFGKVCGAESDGCGGSYDCGSCGAGLGCSAGTCNAAPVCTPLSQGAACSNKTCGDVGDGCGGVRHCGTCSGGQQCGVQNAFQCGTPRPPTCVARTAAQACAGKECGVAFDGCGTGPGNTFNCAVVNSGGSCPSGQFCGIVTPFQCDLPPQQPCTPVGTSCAALGWACGQAINNCGQVFNCAAEQRVCGLFETCTGGITAPTTCEGTTTNCDLCGSVPDCAVGSPTRLTGRVITPGRTDANTPNQVGVPNAFVYILRNNDVGDLPAIGTGIPTNSTSCDRCSEQDLGPVLASAVTDSAGNYTLQGNIPIGQTFLLVTKVGKFRRAETRLLGAGAACTTTLLTTTLPGNPTRLPRSMSDGLGVNIPHIAVSTGQIDAMECVFEKMGVATSEFGNFGSSARVHLYRGGLNSGDPRGARIDGSTPFDSALYTSLARMQTYDMVVADCEGQTWDGTAFPQRIASGANVREYVNRGGRMFASHLSFSWLHLNGTTPFASGTPFATGLGQAASWDTAFTAAGNLDGSGTGVVSLTRPAASPRIQNFADWMVRESVTTSPNYQFAVTDPRSMAQTLGGSSEEFVFRSNGNGRVQQFSFNTPYAAPLAESCGRVAYSGFHVAATGGGTEPFRTSLFPAHCTGNLTNQEKVLLYMLFDLGACVGDEPEPPACVPETCPADDSCGVRADGCGGQLTCGCTGGDVCVNSVCEPPGCVPTTCQAEGVICSSISDGCGHVLACNCPVCQPVSQQQACLGVVCGTASDGCSGVHQCSECPPSCQPLTACPQGIDCGVISDGCSGSLNCGSCESGKLCGARNPNVCATPQCRPLTCEDVDATCGMIGDGCGAAVDCGVCPPGQGCTIEGGIPNQCDGCEPRSCPSAGAQCGLIGDGCGSTVDCGPCPTGQTCGASSPNQCGSGPHCPPQTCAAVGAHCGVIGDGCGGQVDCGVCPSGQLCGVDSPFQCGYPPACSPATCASVGAQCGAIGDGCGGVVDCGTCSSGSTCGLGEANKCQQIR